jgi:hypothetical protein
MKTNTVNHFPDKNNNSSKMSSWDTATKRMNERKKEEELMVDHTKHTELKQN